MTNCLFYTIIFTLFISVSFGSIRFSQLHRAFLSIYKGMLESCIVSIDDQGEPIFPYFNKELVEKNSEMYLKENIERYVENYDLLINYFDKKGGEICEDRCRYITIKLDAKINFFYNYSKTQSFSIISRDQLWMRKQLNT